MHMLKRILALTICVFCLLPVMARANESVLVISEDQALLEVPADIGTVEFIGDIEIENLVINGNVNLYIHDTLDVEIIDQTVGEIRGSCTHASRKPFGTKFHLLCRLLARDIERP